MDQINLDYFKDILTQWLDELLGRDISIERLKARPVAKHCIRCKTRPEERERLTGVG